MEDKFTFTLNGNTIKATGKLDGPGADELVAAMLPNNIYVINFADVCDINFAAIRSLLRARQSGLTFSIIDASGEVAEKFEDTGVSSVVAVCRKPKPLHIDQYEHFGGSFLSESYNSADGDSMIKVYGENVPREVVAREKAAARSVMLFGIPTPLVGTLYEEGNKTAIDFERITGKRSFARIMADEPENVEAYAVKFAHMCKKLHSTQCDTAVFPDRSIVYRTVIQDCKDFTEEERSMILGFLDNVPKATTCIHGDMHVGNVITNGKDDLWIDLSDFSYGFPYFDVGMLMFVSKFNTDELLKHMFHFGRETMDKVWDIFLREYFGAQTAEQKAAAEREVMPFAALQMAFMGASYGFKPFMLPIIRKIFAEVTK